MISVGAVFFTQPLDLVKNRMQMSGKLQHMPVCKLNMSASILVLSYGCTDMHYKNDLG